MLTCAIAMDDRSANGLIECSDAEAARCLEANVARELLEGEPTPEQLAGLVRLASADNVALRSDEVTVQSSGESLAPIPTAEADTSVALRSDEVTDPSDTSSERPATMPEPAPAPKRRAKT